MDRDREPRHSRKRSFAELSDADREYELSMRRKALDNEDHRRRERERPRSPQWRHEDPRLYDDFWRSDGRASAPRGGREEPPRRGYHYKTTASKRHKQASTDQVQSAPIPSTVLSSNPEAPPPGSAAKKSNIKCFNCSRDGHYQSGCKFPAHCSRCDEDGHTTVMCPIPLKPAVLQWSRPVWQSRRTLPP
jgi:hypothetical protein